MFFYLEDDSFCLKEEGCCLDIRNAVCLTCDENFDCTELHACCTGDDAFTGYFCNADCPRGKACNATCTLSKMKKLLNKRFFKCLDLL